METTEKLIFTNQFGSVTEKRVTLNYKSGTEDIPTGQISSVSFQHKRNYFSSIIILIITIAIFIDIIEQLRNSSAIETVLLILAFLLLLISCIGSWIGHHNIVVSVGGQNRIPLKVDLTKTKEGKEFFEAIKKAIFK
jgi:hypothetical protein